MGMSKTPRLGWQFSSGVLVEAQMEGTKRTCTSPASQDLLQMSSGDQACSKSAIGNACQAPAHTIYSHES